MKQRDSFDKMTDSNEDIKPGQSDRDKKGIERQTLIVNSLYFFAPNNWEITTEHPILLPIAIAIKIIVIG